MKSRKMRQLFSCFLLLGLLLFFTQLAYATTVTWTAKTAMPTARTWISAAVYGGKIYVFGGLSETTKLKTVERYDPGTNTWDSRTDMPTARYGASAVTLGDKIYVIGGVNSINQIQNIMEVYDPLSNSWSAGPSMPTARTRLAAVAGPDGKIYAIGGSTSSTMDLTGYTNVVEVYNPATDTWSSGAALNTPRVGLAAAASGDKIYAFGGYGKPTGYTARYLLTVEKFDPATNTWSSAPSMKTTRYGLAATTTPNGLIYLIGGKNESSVIPASNEEYIPSTGSSTIAGLVSGQRSELAAVNISTGQSPILYALGGGNMWTPMNALDAGALSNLPNITPSPTPTNSPPSAITNLAANPGCASGSMLLTWSAPGESGDLGTASTYLVRYSASPIANQTAWDAATNVTANIPAPLQAGTRQSMTITGLTPGNTYYFAIRAVNIAQLMGNLSNQALAQAASGVAQKPWTIMIYAAADNNLDRYIHQDISSLELAAHNSCINLILYWDGLANNDSAYYRLKFDPQMTSWATYVQNTDRWTQDESNMGDPAKLTDFVQWAKTNFPATQYALVIRDHGDGLGGMEEDDRSNDHLTIPELDSALNSITNNGANPLDLLFMDACLMGMLEDGYQFRGQVGIYVASEDVTWSSMRSNSHHDYFYSVSASTTAAQMGDLIVNGYANWMATRLKSYSYTMSAVNSGSLDNLVNATNTLAASLDANMATYSAQIRTSRNASTYFYRREYIDLYDFADKVYTNISDPTIRTHAQAVKSAVGAYVLSNQRSANMPGAHGVSIFFPSDSSSFYNPSNYDFASGATWTGVPPIPGPEIGLNASSWGSLLVHYIQEFPGGPDQAVPPDPVAPEISEELFLPWLHR